MLFWLVGSMAVRYLVGRFRRNLPAFGVAEGGNIAIIFALALIPVMTGVGAALDYARANSAKTMIQMALDAAVLAGARDGSSNWGAVATNVFTSNLASKNLTAPTPSFTTSGNTTYAGSATATIYTSLLGIVGINTLNVNASSTAKFADADNSCILTLDKGQPTSHVSLSLNGAPVVNLSGCTVRSNSSIACNGNDGGIMKSYAAGAATACGKPSSNAPLVPDTYAQLSTNITTVCGSSRPGVSWTPGVLPLSSAFKTVSQSGYTEYHVCGDLTIDGSGYLTGLTPASDTVIVIENGSLIIDDKLTVNTVRTTVVLTGNNSWPARIVFPNGAGKQATLTMSPSTTPGNPWQAVAVFLDPKLTNNVNNSWGPGAAFSADGLVYLGTSNVVTDGNTSSSNSKCTKFVMNSFVTNGAVKLDFAQQNCASLGLKQWGGIIVHLIN
jgi:Flp pilus assembly protein TadG